MSRRKKPGSRCTRCVMRLEICLCSEIDRVRATLKPKTEIKILMHHREKFLSTSTARLAQLLIPDCKIFMRGLINKPINPEELFSSDREAVLLYPTETAVELNADYCANLKKPLTLIVPDGSWRQAAKVSKREDFLKDIRQVYLPLSEPSVYRLRREPKAHGLATIEAIARALGFIEGKEIQNSIEGVFSLMVDRTMRSRGY